MVGENLEVLVCKEAQKRGLISRAQLDECLRNPKPSSSVLLERGFLTEKQLLSLRDEVSRRLATPAPSLPSGPAVALPDGAQRLGKYRLVAELGRGGMGAVHKAWDTTLRRWVALKVLHHLDGPDEVARFRREAQTAATLNHPGIVGVYEIGQEDGTPFIAMEFIEGATLSGRKLEIPEACRLMVAVARAVDHAHRRGIIHRDLKPQNIMLDQAGQVRVMDFGLAKPLRERSKVTVTGTIVGTPSYMPPEQADGHVSQVDHRSDVYSLGAVLYELLTQRPPFEGNTVLDTLAQVVEKDVPRPTRLNRDIPRDLEAIVLRSLEKDKTRRFPSAEAFARDLERFLQGKPVESRPPSLVDRARRHLQRHPAAWMAVTGGVIAFSLLSMLLLRTEEVPAEPPVVRKTAPPPPPPPKPAPNPRALAQPELDLANQQLDGARLDLLRPGTDLSRMKSTLDETVSHFTKALEIFPGHEAALYGRAQARALQGRPADALRDLGRALEILPGYPAARIARGQILMEKVMTFLSAAGWRRDEIPPVVQAWIDQAVDDFKKARASGLAGSDLEFTEASLALAEDKPEKAAAILTRILDSAPRKEEVYKLRGDARTLLAMQTPVGPAQAELANGALQDYSDAIRYRANFHEAYRYRAQLLFLAKRPDLCLEDLRTGLRMNPDDSIALSDLGTYYQRTGESDKALDFFARALELDPENFRALNNRSSLKMERKDYDGARSDLERALRFSPHHLPALVNLAACRDFQGETVEAIRVIDDILARVPKFARGYATRGHFRAHLKQWDLALEDFEKAAALDPADFDAPMKAKRDELRRRAALK